MKKFLTTTMKLFKLIINHQLVHKCVTTKIETILSVAGSVLCLNGWGAGRNVATPPVKPSAGVSFPGRVCCVCESVFRLVCSIGRRNGESANRVGSASARWRPPAPNLAAAALIRPPLTRFVGAADGRHTRAASTTSGGAFADRSSAPDAIAKRFDRRPTFVSHENAEADLETLFLVKACDFENISVCCCTLRIHTYPSISRLFSSFPEFFPGLGLFRFKISCNLHNLISALVAHRALI